MKRRKVGNLLGLGVLSALVERPRHPYEMASVLKERGKDADLQIKWGSLYTVVGNLEKHGFIEAVANEKDGGRPERTVYRLTPAGRTEFEDWVRELVGTLDTEPRRFRAGLSMLSVLGPDQATALLRQRLAVLDEQIETKRAALARWRADVPRLFLVEVEYDLAVTAAEAEWVRAFLADLTGGALNGVEQWRHWYETGEIPGDLGDFVD